MGIKQNVTIKPINPPRVEAVAAAPRAVPDFPFCDIGNPSRTVAAFGGSPGVFIKMVGMWDLKWLI